MSWITDDLPEETGPYLVSINLQRSSGKYAFKYMAYYEKEQNKWFKYDPFELRYKPTDEVEGVVAGWRDDLGVHLNSGF